MKIFLIADNTETFVGMRLAGIDGIIVHGEAEFLEAFKSALADEEIGILLIMDKLYMMFSDLIMEKKMSCSTPLIVSIPDRGSDAAISKSVSSYIETAIGMKI